MRKIFWLFMMLLLAACGGGGGTSADAPAGGKGTLALEVVKAAGPVAKTVAAPTAVPASPGRVRVVVTETTTGYRAYVDQALGVTTTANFSLPLGTYTVEAVLYEKGYPNVVTDYGIANNVAVGQTGNSAALAVAPVAVTLPVPTDPVYSGGSYSVAAVPAADLLAAGLQEKWSLASSTSAFIGRKHLAQAPSATHLTMTAPTGSGTMYLQGEFFAKASLINPGEAATDFAFFTGDSVVLNAAGLPVDVTHLGISDTQKPVVKSFSVPGEKQGVANVLGISVLATDNGGVKDYAITTSDTEPAANSTDWKYPASFSYGGPISDSDTVVTLYAWARDFNNNVSLQSAATSRQIVFNNSPVVTGFGVPSAAVIDGTKIPVTIFGKGYAGTGTLECAITETDTLPADPTWLPMSAPTLTKPATYTGLYSALNTPAEGVKMVVKLYAWVKDSAGKISPAVSRTAAVHDIPQITAFTATPAPAGTVVSITMDAVVAEGRTFGGYAVTTTNVQPETGWVMGAKPTGPVSFTYDGLNTFPVTKALYLWVKDSLGYVSLPQGTLATFMAP
ncbi:hypothetical protein M1B72_15580 [Geomonas paludis]|uniref:Lipoprotein n=1 Tax=Geomonas paludis TaxID=2740185 RepID=A0ABY4LDM0_9BACT|nr:hypothetical protein [Geomonas paludis]UPU34858.1 hypothetical protein M1B72_15580 [Geomonas paludis]